MINATGVQRVDGPPEPFVDPVKEPMLAAPEIKNAEPTTGAESCPTGAFPTRSTVSLGAASWALEIACPLVTDLGSLAVERVAVVGGTPLAIGAKGATVSLLRLAATPEELPSSG